MFLLYSAIMADETTKPLPSSSTGEQAQEARPDAPSERPPINPGNLVTFQKGAGEFGKRFFNETVDGESSKHG
jgi:hypothetical protein